MSFLGKLLSVISGNNGLKMSEQLLFDKVIGFRGIVPGVGTSTIVQNVAIALSSTTNLSICVVDANYLYPVQYPMLIKKDDTKRLDLLDYDGELSDIILSTEHRNVYLVSMYNRNIVDMLSSKDNPTTADSLVESLKSFFDIILIDLSYEPTNVSTQLAVKCNRVVNIADLSLKSTYHLRKSLNTMATLAVPFAKANSVIMNKVLPDVVTNSKTVFAEAGMTLLGEIPLSKDIATAGVIGKPIYASKTSSKDILSFSLTIDKVLEHIIQNTPLNEHLLNPSEEDKAKYDEEVKQARAKAKSKGKKDSNDQSTSGVSSSPVETTSTTDTPSEIQVASATPALETVEDEVKLYQDDGSKVEAPTHSGGVVDEEIEED